MLEHLHVRAIRPAYGTVKGAAKPIYVIETDLALSEKDPAFDRDALGDLLFAAKDYLAANPVYHGLKIIPYLQR
ncbi:hypothetical protein [Mesorhizobium sp. CN2-181]|uniref:hypothetical protein n=1 Tax=Mesorhizobium yinganensis TaxID=3157707 RepID=UPI0032B859B3